MISNFILSTSQNGQLSTADRSFVYSLLLPERQLTVVFLNAIMLFPVCSQRFHIVKDTINTPTLTVTLYSIFKYEKPEKRLDNYFVNRVNIITQQKGRF